MSKEFKNEEIIKVDFTSDALTNKTSQPGLTQTRVLEELMKLAEERKLVSTQINAPGGYFSSFSFTETEKVVDPNTGEIIYQPSTLIIDVDRRKCGRNNINIAKLEEIASKTSCVKKCNTEALKKIGKFILIAGATAILVSKVVIPVADTAIEKFVEWDNEIFEEENRRIAEYYQTPDGGDYREEIVDRMEKGRSY